MAWPRCAVDRLTWNGFGLTSRGANRKQPNGRPHGTIMPDVVWLKDLAGDPQKVLELLALRHSPLGTHCVEGRTPSLTLGRRRSNL